MDGRGVEVIEALPKEEGPVAEPEEEYARHFKITLWVDPVECEIVRLKATVIEGAVVIAQQLLSVSPGSETAAGRQIHDSIAPGSVLVEEWTKINHEAWLPKSIHMKITRETVLDLSLQPGSVPLSFAEEWIWTYSNYKKFRVDTHVVPQ